jgi:hypothetical protein
MHCFEDVTAILFLISLADYNLKVEEDASANRLEESVNVFGNGKQGEHQKEAGKEGEGEERKRRRRGEWAKDMKETEET